MTGVGEHECKDPSSHWMHICQLRREGRHEDANVLMADPGHTCLNCNAVARYAKNLCNPSSFSRV